MTLIFMVFQSGRYAAAIDGQSTDRPKYSYLSICKQ